MVENINEEEVTKKILELKGRLAKAKKTVIANELIELGAIPCVEGVYLYSDESNHTFLVIYDSDKIDDLEKLNGIIEKLNDNISTLSKYKYDMNYIEMEQLKTPIVFFPSRVFYNRNRLAKSECLYANESVKTFVKHIN